MVCKGTVLRPQGTDAECAVHHRQVQPFVQTLTNPTSKSYEQIREELKYCHSLGSRFVDFEGGEPLLWRDGDKTVNDLCDLAHELGFYSCTITTNAQLPFAGCRADSIWVSLDGIGKYHEAVRGEGTFARLEENVAGCGHKALSVAMSVNRLNCDSVAQVLDYVKASPYIKSISFNFHTPFPGTESLTHHHPLQEEGLPSDEHQGWPDPHEAARIHQALLDNQLCAPRRLEAPDTGMRRSGRLRAMRLLDGGRDGRGVPFLPRDHPRRPRPEG